MISGDHLANWLSRLVQIPSVSPDQAGPRAGTPGEGRLAGEVAGWFREFGGEVHQEEVLPGRPNVYGLWRGQSDRWLALDVHMDTAGVEQMTGEPFSGLVAAGRVYGRGAVDTKASLAVALALLEALHRAGQRPGSNLLVAATVDEEVGAHGAPALAAWVCRQGLSLAQLIVAEPTGCGPVYGHKGVLRLEFEVAGQPAHSSQPDLGRNAITGAAGLVLALAEEHRRLQSLPPTPLGAATLTVSLIEGGSGINVVPAACRVSLDRRLLADEGTGEVAAGLAELARRACPLPVNSRVLLAIDAFWQSPDTPWLRQLAAWSGREPAIVPYGTNAWAYGGLAGECAVLGPGSIDQAHGAEEWVTIAELEKLAEIYTRWWEVEL